MEKSLKIGIWAALGATSLAAAWFLYRNFKKGMADLNKQETDAKTALTGLGLSEQTATELMQQPENEQEEGMVRTMFALARKSTEREYMLENDRLNPNSFVSGYENVIHVTESDYRGKKQLDFIIRIPDYTVGSYNTPRIGDYIKTFKDVAKEMATEIVKFTPYPHTKLAGYAAITYTNPDYKESDPESLPILSEYIELPSSVYADYAEEPDEDGRKGRDGLTKFYEAYLKGETSEESLERLKKALLEFINLKERDINVNFIEMFLGFKISFPESGKDGIGIDFKRGAKCIKYLIEEVEVVREGRTTNDTIRYNSVLFCTTDPNGNPSLAYHYEIGTGGKIVARPLPELEFEYEEED